MVPLQFSCDDEHSFATEVYTAFLLHPWLQAILIDLYIRGCLSPHLILSPVVLLFTQCLPATWEEVMKVGSIANLNCLGLRGKAFSGICPSSIRVPLMVWDQDEGSEGVKLPVRREFQIAGAVNTKTQRLVCYSQGTSRRRV